ncbi:hydrogenase nickel incorporation protein HypB [Sporobacter termitidis DSM 10068]|uniref:Hydrogenase nickel incorporation protein HypB n=1 Tax=Sporobacter termitidis DSM 10068 TaxID=1123282 RepID=A0A1M5Z0L5_9FIRM|nr:hydrogenase nickel incorporation protein HypB [Sporobacter termitidis]SHI17739.1 hydrogenase nickel incorporation protein HypB [Sporobacter termitidis DSM 10068]
MSTKTVEVMENIYSENDKISDEISAYLKGRGIYAVNVMGAPGIGKTSSLIKLIEGLEGVKAYVVEGDIQSDIDTAKLRSLGIDSVQINTGGACHLDAVLIDNTVKALAPKEKGVLFIENIGNLVCPAEFNIGEDMKLLVSSVTEGADKPYKYPLAFEKAAAVLLNKTDLLPYVDFDLDYFEKGVRALNPAAPIFKVSSKTGEGFDEVVTWLIAKMAG